MTRRTAVVGVATFLFTGGTFLAQAGKWQVLMYPDPAPGVASTYCVGMNESGDMVGYYNAPGSPSRGFLLTGGQYYSLLAPGATGSTAWGINAAGDIVGQYGNSAVPGVTHGFLLRHNEFVTIDLEGQAMTHPRDINALGDIAGFYMTTSTSPQVGFVLTRNGTVIDVQYPGATRTTVEGINDRGDVTGLYNFGSGPTRSFVRTEDGEFTPLDHPDAYAPSNTTQAQKISADGTVFGWYNTPSTTYPPNVSHGFVWRHGEFEQVDYPGAIRTMIHGANNQGETCGMMGLPGVTGWRGFGHVW